MNHLPLLLLTVALLMVQLIPQNAAADTAPPLFADKYQSGQAQLLAGNFADALKDFESALRGVTTGSQSIQAQLGIAAAHVGMKNVTAAKNELIKATSIADAEPDLRGQALIALAELYAKQYQWQPATASLNKALAIEGMSGSTQYSVHMGIANIYTNYGNWAKVKVACLAALSTSGNTPEQIVGTQKLLAKALVNLREFADARTVMQQMLSQGDEPLNATDQPAPRVVLDEYIAGKLLPAAQRAHLQMGISKTFMAERNFAQAREAFINAMAMPGMTNALRAEAQLYVGLSYYEAGDDINAKTELLKVLDMPDANTRPAWTGGRMGYVPAREARLRLQFRKLIPDEPPALKVLFIGSSHTLRENLPQLVTEMAASAPQARQRILAGDYIYMGTNIATFWNAGDSPDTVRGVIANGPWDVVVFETFYNMNLADMTKYVKLFADLIRNHGATPVIYESPLPKGSPYPARFQQFHNDNLVVSESMKIALAPSVGAWMRRMGPSPTDEQFGEVYADWIHASQRGAYITASCIYAAVTGQNPAGLFHPAELTDDYAAALQTVAWESYLESNAASKAVTTPDTTDTTLP